MPKYDTKSTSSCEGFWHQPNTCFLGPQVASQAIHLFLLGSSLCLTHTDRHKDRETMEHLLQRAASYAVHSDAA